MWPNSHETANFVTITEEIFKGKPHFLWLETSFNTNLSCFFGSRSEDFFIICDQIRMKLQIWSQLLKKFLLENLIFCALFHINSVTSPYPMIRLAAYFQIYHSNSVSFYVIMSY